MLVQRTVTQESFAVFAIAGLWVAQSCGGETGGGTDKCEAAGDESGASPPASPGETIRSARR